MDGPAYPNIHTPRSCHTGQDRPFEDTIATKKPWVFMYIGVLIKCITFRHFC